MVLPDGAVNWFWTLSPLWATGLAAHLVNWRANG